MKHSFLLFLFLFFGNVSASIYPDVDGASGVFVGEKSVYVITFESTFYFDNLFRSAAEGEELYLNVGFDDEEKMAEELVGIFKPEIITLGDGSVRGLVFSMEDHAFTKDTILNYLEAPVVLKLTVWNGDWFSTFKIARKYELKKKHEEKLLDLYQEYQLSR